MPYLSTERSLHEPAGLRKRASPIAMRTLADMWDPDVAARCAQERKVPAANATPISAAILSAVPFDEET
jgi:hypothetical protein